jgi:hypothetical protein
VVDELVLNDVPTLDRVTVAGTSTTRTTVWPC